MSILEIPSSLKGVPALERFVLGMAIADESVVYPNFLIKWKN